MTESPAAQARAQGHEFQRAIKRALNQRKSVARPRVTFETLAEASNLSTTTVKRLFKLDGGGRDPDIDVPVLWAFASTLGVSVDELMRQARVELAASAGIPEQEQEARELMGEEAWLNLQATREAHRSRQPQKRRKA